MASQDFDAMGAPTDIVAGLGLAAGELYQGQNTSTTATLRVRESVAAPTADARAIRIEAGGNFTFSPDGTNGIWLWTDEPAGCPVILTPAP